MTMLQCRPVSCGLVIALSVGLGAAAGGRQPPPAEQLPRPSFTTGVSLVTAEVTVVDDDGRPIRDLGPEDFTVRVDGRPRAITTVQFVDQTPPPPDAGKARPQPLYSTNESRGTGRLVAIVVDQGNIRSGSGRAALRAADQLLASLTPADRVAVFAVPAPGPRVPFTDDLDRVRQALSRITGQVSPFDTSRYALGVGEAIAIADGDRQTLQQVVARECGGTPNCDSEIEVDAQTMAAEVHQRTFASLTSLEATVAELVPVAGPKTIVLLSEGLVADRGFQDLSTLGELMARAHASLYVLRLSGGSSGAASSRAGASTLDLRLQTEGLETLAGLARGTVFNVTGSGSNIYERVAREISGYYLLTFEPTESDRDGKPHRIRVDVDRPDVSVRARREFMVRPPQTERQADGEILGGALGSPLVMSEVPINVSTYNFSDATSSKIRLVIAAEIGREHAVAEEEGLAFALFDAQGRVVDSGMQRVTLVPRDGATPSPLVYNGALTVEPGTYVLKLAVVDAEGRVGTVEHPVRAGLAGDGPIRLGDLVIGPRRRTARAMRPPTEPRVGGQAFSFVEVSGNEGADLERAVVTIEIAETPEGAALVSSPAPYLDSPTPSHRQATANLDLSVLPPGRYVARARVDVDGRTVASVIRRFEVETEPAETPTAAGGGTAGRASGAPVIEAGSLVDPFTRDELFRPAVINGFLDEILANLSAAPPQRVLEALDEARSGRLAEAASTAKSEALHPLTTFLRGLVALQKGDLEAAANFFRSTLHAAPGSYSAMVYLAACYAAGGRDDEAAGAWQTSLLGIDDSPLVFQLLADAAMRAGDGATAVEVLQEALGTWPDDPRFTRRLATAVLLYGRPTDGMVVMDRHLDLHPDDERALFIALQFLYELRAAGRVVESPRKDFERATRYADAYARAGGAQQPLVGRWLKDLETHAGEQGG
jgi:VWFA-related protein